MPDHTNLQFLIVTQTHNSVFLIGATDENVSIIFPGPDLDYTGGHDLHDVSVAY